MQTIDAERQLALDLVATGDVESVGSFGEQRVKYLNQLQGLRDQLDFAKCVYSGSWLSMSQLVHHAHICLDLPDLSIVDSKLVSDAEAASDVAQLHSSVTVQQAWRDADRESSFVVNNNTIVGGALALETALIAELGVLGQNTASDQCKAIVQTILCAAARTVSGAESYFSCMWLAREAQSKTPAEAEEQDAYEEDPLDYSLQLFPSHTAPPEPVRITLACDEHIRVAVNSVNVYDVCLQYDISANDPRRGANFETGNAESGYNEDGSNQSIDPLTVLILRTRVIQHLYFARGLSSGSSGSCVLKMM